MNILPERLEIIDKVLLDVGAHRQSQDLSHGACIMELTAWLANEPWSDKPVCVDGIIGMLLRAMNDSLNTQDRQSLKPYAIKIINTNHGIDLEIRRAWVAIDWLIRTYIPAWIDHNIDGELLAQSKEIIDTPSFNLVLPILKRIAGVGPYYEKNTLGSMKLNCWKTLGIPAWNVAWYIPGPQLIHIDIIQIAAWSASESMFVNTLLNNSLKETKKQMHSIIAELKISSLYLLDRMINTT